MDKESFSIKPKKNKKTFSYRRDGREAAIQYLYSKDIAGKISISDEDLKYFWITRIAKDKSIKFAEFLIKKTEKNLSKIDEQIINTLRSFAFHRLALIDRNILRVAVCEILFCNHIHPKSAINEAIEISKRFGNKESPKFINGSLDTIFKKNMNNN